MLKSFSMRYCLLLIFLLFFTSAWPQDSASNPVFWGLKPHYGFIIPHSKAIRDISSSSPYGMGLDYGWVLAQEQDWQRCNCYSRAGFSVLYANYGNPEVLGSSLNLIMFAEPYLDFKGDWKTSLRMGVGPSYITKVYDEEENPENLFFSSHLSFIIHLDLTFHIRVSERWFLNVYAKYNHISNGGIDEPNKGMNFPTFGAGMDHTLEPLQLDPRQPEPVEDKGIVPSLGVFATMKNVVVGEGDVKKRTFGFGALAKARKNVTRLNALSLGAEYLWDGEIREKTAGNHKHRQVSLLAGNELLFGKFIFSQYWGTYLYAPYYKKNFFQRYALTYQVSEHLRLGVTLKAHAEVAQNFNVLIDYDMR